MQILAQGPHGGPPTTAPTSLSAVPTNVDVAISFTAPSNDGGLTITNYEYSFNNSSWTALSPADATSPVTVGGLTQNTAYTIYLRAVNVAGSGPASTGVSFTTVGVPTGTATISSISSVTQTTATVNYSIAAGGGAITGYELYIAGGTNAWNTTTASPISVTGLTANTAYTFYVRAKNAYGNGPQSAGVASTTTRNLISMDVFVVGGGAGGAGGYYPQGGGGGGGGGANTGTLTLGAGTYTATIGGGGAAGAQSAAGPSGAGSAFHSISVGAGNGGNGTGGGGTSGNGYGGGSGSGAGGGGGGAFGGGSNGTSGNPCIGGNGGTGATNSYRTGSNEQFAGGGGGSVQNQSNITAGTGLGQYGGGNGCQFNLGSGSDATYYGGGGGGGVHYNVNSGAAGYQGIVVVRYLTSAATGYTISGGTPNTYGSYTSRTFTGTANLVIS